MEVSHATWIIISSYLRDIYGAQKNLFDGIKQQRISPIELSGDQLLQQLENVPNFPFGKDEEKKKNA